MSSQAVKTKGKSAKKESGLADKARMAMPLSCALQKPGKHNRFGQARAGFVLVVSMAFLMLAAPPARADVEANPDAAIVSEDGSVDITVLANDRTTGSPLTITSVTSPENGIAAISGNQITYTPDPDYFGSDSFTYEISADGFVDSATVFVTVNEANDPPEANNDTAVVDEDGEVVISVLANDSDPDGDPLSVAGAGNAPNGETTYDPAGTVTYTPDGDFNGSDAFSYSITDGRGGVASGVITVTVNPANDNPTAVGDTVFATAGVSKLIDVLLNDSDLDGDPIAIDSLADPANGTAVIEGNKVRYNSSPGFEGVDTFQYSITDGLATSTATVTISVSGSNSPPEARNDSGTTTSGVAIVLNVLANDSDPDGDGLSVAFVGPSARGTTTLNADGTIRYTPEPGFVGVDGFTYTLADGSGGEATAAVTVVVAASLAGPQAVNDAITVNEDEVIEFDLLANDELTPGAALGSVGEPVNGEIVLLPNGNIEYRPSPNYTGFDSFTYSIVDDLGRISFAAATVTVVQVNDVPVAIDDFATTNKSTPVVVDVLANDTDDDGELLFIQLVSSPNDGQVRLVENEFVYTPDPDFVGVDVFTYQSCDSTDCSVAVVQVDVIGPPDSPPTSDPDGTPLNPQSTAIPPPPDVLRPTLTPSLGFSAAARASLESLGVLLLPLTLLGILTVWALTSQHIPTLFFWRRRKDDDEEEASPGFYG